MARPKPLLPLSHLQIQDSLQLAVLDNKPLESQLSPVKHFNLVIVIIYVIMSSLGSLQAESKAFKAVRVDAC